MQRALMTVLCGVLLTVNIVAQQPVAVVVETELGVIEIQAGAAEAQRLTPPISILRARRKTG